MQQYMSIKEQHKDAILFYRLGDFYEMFFDDAILASKELGIALTARNSGSGNKTPMCGIPQHVADSYLNRLVEKGHKVVVVDQVEDPREAKGLVKRQVTHIVTPGTLRDLDGDKIDNNFLLAIYAYGNSYGLSYIDITTGEFVTSEFLNINNERIILDYIAKINPSEVIINEVLNIKLINDYFIQKHIYVSVFDSENKDIPENIKRINSLIKNKLSKELEKKYFSILSSAMLLDYIYLYQDTPLEHIISLDYLEPYHYMRMDPSTRDNLEIHQSLYDKSKQNTLVSVLDKTNTAMGSRKLNSWLEFPLLDVDAINARLDIVAYLKDQLRIRNRLEGYLEKIYDLERLLSKISYQRANPKDLLSLKYSIEHIPNLKVQLETLDFEPLQKMGKSMDDLRDLYTLIDAAILETEPVKIHITEGNIIKKGFSKELDEKKHGAIKGKEELAAYESRLIKDTNIKNLKIAYTNNIGYFIELTKANIDLAPDYFIRRQTLKNSERYYTDELNKIADRILDSQSDTVDLEYDIFVNLRAHIALMASRIKMTTDLIATLDALLSFANVASNNDYTRPVFNNEDKIYIKDGRHPVVEQVVERVNFISNDTDIGAKDNRIQLITGPNMAGKSTYMRQVALIILMAQCGSFVPASGCNISISDAVYTRIGASDNLAKGESTFMVEMNEMSNIIANSTEKSFVVLDEVGRGTSTNDGLSIAVAIVEHLSQHIKAKTLFATHFHELTQITDHLDNVSNLKVEILEEDGNLVFLRKIMPGSADRSYGIEVAKLSGLPDQVLKRANQILKSMDNKKVDFIYEKSDQLFMNIENLEKDLLLRELAETDLDNMTAKEAYDYLYQVQKKAGDLFDD